MAFIDLGVKANGAFYRNLLLLQQLLSAISQISSEFIFQLNSLQPTRVHGPWTRASFWTPVSTRSVYRALHKYSDAKETRSELRRDNDNDNDNKNL